MLQPVRVPDFGSAREAINSARNRGSRTIRIVSRLRSSQVVRRVASRTAATRGALRPRHRLSRRMLSLLSRRPL